jgi:signal transduction histidine kinase
LHSLQTRLLVVWIMLVISSAVTGLLLWQLYQQSANVQIAQAEGIVVGACRDIADRYAFYGSGWSGRDAAIDNALRSDLQEVVKAALGRADGVEGGIWHSADGSLAYAYPTYQGTGPKTDVPSAELPAIQRINDDVLRAGRPVTVRRSGPSQVMVVHACPLNGPIPDTTAWTMTRVFTGQGLAYNQLLAGLAVLALTVFGSAAGLAGALVAWSRKIARLEAALAARETGRGEFPALARTGERELDRLVDVLNATGEQLKDERQRSAAAERLAAVGRLAAGLAHEIRNPIAAMRLKAENALCSDREVRLKMALQAILDQVGRLDALLHDLLTMTHQSLPKLVETDMQDLLRRSVETHAELAASRGIALQLTEDPPVMAHVDAGQIGRCLDNLVLNAIQNTPSGGMITISATSGSGLLCLRVADTGVGVPAEIRDRLFEPFVTGRSDGTGLGLAIAREIVRAHGGDARLVDSGEGAVFEIELPWQRS